MEDQKPTSATSPARGWLARSLDVVERAHDDRRHLCAG